MDGPKPRRGGQQHDIHAAIDYFLIRVQADEALIRRHFNFIRVFLLQALQALLELIFEYVSHCGQHDVFVSVERLTGGAGTATTTTDQTNSKGFIVLFPEKSSRQNRRCGQCAADHSGGFKKVPTCSNSIGWRFHMRIISKGN